MSDEKFCGFCGKSQHHVGILIAAPTTFVCEECIALCVEIIAKRLRSTVTVLPFPEPPVPHPAPEQGARVA